MTTQPSLTLAECQAMIETMMQRTGWNKKSLEDQGLGFAEESGEVCQALRRIVRYGANGERVNNLADELADVLIYLCHLASRHNIDLSQAFDKKAHTIANGILNK